MIRQLILSKQSYLQLVIVLFGSVFGLLMVMSSTQIYKDITSIFNTKKDLVSAQFLVVNKSVNILNTISGEAAVFSQDEINRFKSLRSVEKIGIFKANRFRAQTGFQLQDKAMMTDMFFESVPDEFLDSRTAEWHWTEGKVVPIILPTDYLNLYNFGFAPSQGLPQISRGTAKLAALKIIISGNGKTLELPGMIVGFTDRINSILVPEVFLDYANLNYSNSPEKGTSRLVVLSKDISNIELSEYIQDNGYETNMELLKNGKLSALLSTILSVILTICLVIVVLSILGFIQYSQLLIHHAKYEIKTLLLLGYRVKVIVIQYFKFYVLILVVVVFFSFVAFYFVKYLFNQLMLSKGFEINSYLSLDVALYGLFVVMVFLVLNSINTFFIITRIARSKQ